MQRSKESSGAAAVMSFLVPGLGQIFNGHIGFGIALLVGFMLGICLIPFLVGFPICLFIWVWAIFDAYTDGTGQKKKRPHKYAPRTPMENLNELYGGQAVDVQDREAANRKFFEN